MTDMSRVFTESCAKSGLFFFAIFSLIVFMSNYNAFVADSSIDFLVGPYSSKLSLKAAEVARVPHFSIQILNEPLTVIFA